MCSACGTQNEREKGGSKVFSVRRSISSWTDVVHLIINCLKVKSLGQQYFDFDVEIMPFFDKNIERLHLPRMVCGIFLLLHIFYFLKISCYNLNYETTFI